MMQYLVRLRDWWLGQFHGTTRLGKAAMLLVPLLFACCALTTCSVLLVPPAADPAPTAVAAARSQPATEPVERAATVDVATESPTQTPEPPAPTDEPTATDAPPATPRPTNTARPTATPTVTTAPTVPAALTMGAATALFATAAARPTTAPTAASPTAVQPTASPPAAPTQPPPPPAATLPPVAAPGDVAISSIFYNGVVEQVESDEYAVITNRGAAVVNLNGWRLNAGEPDQNFYFPAFDLQPDQSCRVYTNEAHPESCGFSFNIGSAIWRNSGDCGTLHDATGAEVSRYCW